MHVFVLIPHWLCIKKYGQANEWRLQINKIADTLTNLQTIVKAKYRSNDRRN